MSKDKGSTLADKIKFIDFYKDLPRDLAEPTVSGASGKNYPIMQQIGLTESYYSFYVCRGLDGCVIPIRGSNFHELLKGQRDYYRCQRWHGKGN